LNSVKNKKSNYPTHRGILKPPYNKRNHSQPKKNKKSSFITSSMKFFHPTNERLNSSVKSVPTKIHNGDTRRQNLGDFLSGVEYNSELG
jgi:hypothetical protein